MYLVRRRLRLGYSGKGVAGRGPQCHRVPVAVNKSDVTDRGEELHKEEDAMSRRGVRRSISIRVEVYWRLKQLMSADDDGKASCALVEDMIDERADARGIPKIDREEALRLLPSKPRSETATTSDPPTPEIISQHFTF